MKPYFFALLSLSLDTAHADSSLEYLITETGVKQQKHQTVFVKDGKIFVRGVGGDNNTDILYTSAPESLAMIDHRKRNVMVLDEAQINQLAKQSEVVQPLLQGFAGQIAKLNPQQRGRWEQMLGGKVSLDQIAQAAQPAPSAKVVKTGQSRKVANVDCEAMEVWQEKKRTAELCLANASALKLPDADYTAIRALLGFAERLATKTQGLAHYFDAGIPSLNWQDLAGVPVEVRDRSRHNRGSVRLQQINTAEIAAALMELPKDYASEPFKLWK
jgi:hypothetical protein